MHAMMETSPAGALSQEVLLAGFRDCMDEAVRYLTEVEQIPTEASVLQGLLGHLETQEQHLSDGSGADTVQVSTPPPIPIPNQIQIQTTTPEPSSMPHPVFRVQNIGGQMYLVQDPDLSVTVTSHGGGVLNATSCRSADTPSESLLGSTTAEHKPAALPYASDVNHVTVDKKHARLTPCEDFLSRDMDALMNASPQIESVLAELLELLEDDDDFFSDEEMDMF